MTHYGLDPELAIYHILVDTNTGEVVDCKCIPPAVASELNFKLAEVRSVLRWVRDPAGP